MSGVLDYSVTYSLLKPLQILMEESLLFQNHGIFLRSMSRLHDMQQPIIDVAGTVVLKLLLHAVDVREALRNIKSFAPAHLLAETRQDPLSPA
jgi:hypothetical protein